jgi:hypothetical protein
MQPANAKHAMFVAWALCGLTLATAAVAVALGVTVDGVESAVPEAGAQGPVDSDATGLLTFGMVAAFAVVGAVVAARRPRNPVGWFLGAIPALLALAMLAEGIYWHAAVAGDGDAGAAEFGLWFADTWWIPTLLLVFVLLPLLFPSGRPPTPRWNLVAWVAAAGGSILFVGTAFQPGRLATYAWVENPLAVQGMPAAVSGIGFAAAVAATLGALASLVVRFRRSRGVERQQLKWFLAAAVQLVVLWVASAALEPVVSDNASWAILLTGLLGVAIAVALAILRHRLYDIDLVVNRALVTRGRFCASGWVRAAGRHGMVDDEVAILSYKRMGAERNARCDGRGDARPARVSAGDASMSLSCTNGPARRVAPPTATRERAAPETNLSC